jgi:hypothetical protein
VRIFGVVIWRELSGTETVRPILLGVVHDEESSTMVLTSPTSLR